MNTRLLPLAGFAVLVALLGFGISWMRGNAMNEVTSPLIDKPAPVFQLPLLLEPGRALGTTELAGKPYLLNVFASWCFACLDEHPLLMAEAKRLGVPLVGFNYKDEADDAKRWLARFGDPYTMIVADRDGRVAIDFGVYGAPETFLVDAQGVIRYKRIGAITPMILATEIKPRLAAMAKGNP
jgi:cytochrome c biogenesis protein CcmG/thiol:disulfide interchange protein DsbE